MDEEKKELVLHGNVVLDEASMRALRNQIRDEVVEKIQKDGLYSEEAERFMEMCSLSQYMRILENTAEDMLKKAEEEDSHWTDDIQKVRTLKAIVAVLSL